MSERRFCTVRFNLGNTEHQRAWGYLQNMDRQKYKSYSSVIIAALNEYFKEKDNDFTDEIVERVLSGLVGGVDIQLRRSDKTVKNKDNIAWDFLGDTASILKNDDFNIEK